VIGFIPRLLGAASSRRWLVATIVKLVTTRGLRLRVDERLNQPQAQAQPNQLFSDTIGNALLVDILLFLVPVLILGASRHYNQ